MVKTLQIQYEDRILGKELITIDCDNHTERITRLRKKSRVFGVIRISWYTYLSLNTF